jgi:hypothetical protein
MIDDMRMYAEFDYGNRKKEIFEITAVLAAIQHGTKTNALYFTTFMAEPADVTATHCNLSNRHDVSGRHFTNVTTVSTPADIVAVIDKHSHIKLDRLKNIFAISSNDYRINRESTRAFTTFGLIKAYNNLPTDARLIGLSGRNGRILLEPNDIAYNKDGTQIWPQTPAAQNTPATPKH